MSSDDHRKALQILDMGIANSTHLIELARLEGVGSQRCSAGAGSSTVIGAISDDRTDSHRHVAHRLSNKEHLQIQLTCKEPEFAALPARADRANPRQSKIIH